MNNREKARKIISALTHRENMDIKMDAVGIVEAELDRLDDTPELEMDALDVGDDYKAIDKARSAIAKAVGES